MKKCSNKLFEFTILADISFHQINNSQNPYDFFIPCSRLQSMNPLEFYREKLTVPINDDTVILTYYVKKVSATRVHVVIENNIEGLKINGKLQFC